MSDGSASEGPRRARRGVLELDARGLELVADRVGGREVLGGPRGGPLLEQGADERVDGGDAATVRQYVDGFAAAGCDELILFPCDPDPGQVDLLADALA